MVKSKKNEIEIIEKNEQLWTTSLDIAKNFGKRHFIVMRSIQNLDCSEQFREHNFVLAKRHIEGHPNQEYYEISRDGFAYLVMGFSGKKAAIWKEKYIDAFNKMTKVIIKQARIIRRQAMLLSDSQWRIDRENGKKFRHDLTDIIKIFESYAESQGSENHEKFYMVYTKMEYGLLYYIVDGIKTKNIRDMLSGLQLVQLAAVEIEIAKVIKKGMDDKLYYKEIYKNAKQKVIDYVNVIGKSHITLSLESPKDIKQITASN